MDGLRRPHVRRIVLADFRSYARLDLALPRANVALSGLNGAGKTNLLEALSFLTPGRGLRRADLAECVREGGGGGWAVSVEIDDEPGGLVLPVQLGTGLEPGDAARKCRVDRVPTASARSFADHVRIVWLTPAMDGLFTGPASERRRFLDRIVLTVDSDHAARVTGLDRALRNRNRVLEEGRQSGRLDQAWAEATEREVAALGTAVAAARHETVARLAALIESGRDDGSPFPWAEIALRAPSRIFWSTARRSRPRTASAPCCARTAPATPPPAAPSRAPTSPTSRSATAPNAPTPAAPRPANRKPCWSASSWPRPASSTP